MCLAEALLRIPDAGTMDALIADKLSAADTVIAKPAEQTSLVAWRLTALLYEAGILKDVLAFLPGAGVEIGNALLYDPRVVGVAFTGSTATVRTILPKLISGEVRLRI